MKWLIRSIQQIDLKCVGQMHIVCLTDTNDAKALAMSSDLIFSR